MTIRNYWLKQKCYLAQAGSGQERLIEASLECPVKVRLDDTVYRGGVPEPRKTDRFLVIIDDENPVAPEKPIDVRPGQIGFESIPANLAQPIGGGEEGKGRRKQRAADM